MGALIATATTGLRMHPGFRQGPALRSTPLATRSVIVSVVGHIGLAVALIATASWRTEKKPTVYVVNLVPAVAAVGSPLGRANSTPQAPPRAEPAPHTAPTAPKAAPAANQPAPTARPTETASIPAPPEPTREARRPSIAMREAPALPEGPRLPDAPLSPPAHPKLHVPALPSQRAPLRPAEDESVRPSRLADLPRESRPPAARSTPPADVPHRSSLRDLPPDGVRRLATLPDHAAVPDVPAPPSQPTAIRPADAERPVPRRSPELPREYLARPDRFTPSDDASRRPALADLPTDGTRRLAAPPGQAVAREVRVASAPAFQTRQLSMPKVGQKESPSLTSPSPVLTAATSVTPRPAATPAAPVATPTVTVATASSAPAPAAVALGHPTGSPQGSGAITMNVSDFPFAWYLQTVQRKVSERWAPTGRGTEGRAVVVFEIGRNGEVGRPSVEDSSGDAVYDRAALRAITEANPFPPLPAEFKESVLRIHLGFNFTADRG